MKKLPEFLSKLRESEKVETMGRTARRRQGVFFGRLGVPERSGAGAAGSGRCAVGVCFSERAAAGRWAGPAVRGRCGAGAGAESRRGVCFSVGCGEEHGRGGAGGRGERRRGQRGWDGCAGISRSPSRFRESPRRDRVRGRRCRVLQRSGGCVFRLGTGRGRAQRSSSTSTTGRVWRLKVLPLPSLMGITVAR